MDPGRYLEQSPAQSRTRYERSNQESFVQWILGNLQECKISQNILQNFTKYLSIHKHQTPSFCFLLKKEVCKSYKQRKLWSLVFTGFCLFQLLHTKKNNAASCTTILLFFSIHLLIFSFSTLKECVMFRFCFCEHDVSLLQPILPMEWGVSVKTRGNNRTPQTLNWFYLLISLENEVNQIILQQNFTHCGF